MVVFFISKGKRDAEKSDNGKCHVEYHKTAGNGTSDMMDGLAVGTDDDNRCVFVSTISEKSATYHNYYKYSHSAQLRVILGSI